MRKNPYSIIVISIFLIVCLWQITNMGHYSKPYRVIRSDVISYYAYLPATFIEKDHKLQFNLRDENGIWRYWPDKAPNGGLVIKTSMGMAIMYAPFFFIAHHFAEKMGYKANGFTTPYTFALVYSCIIYILIGFLFLLISLVITGDAGKDTLRGNDSSPSNKWLDILLPYSSNNSAFKGFVKELF